MNSILK